MTEYSEDSLVRAAEVVAIGGIIGFPTDTVYGIGCSPSRHDAIQRIYTLKQRDARKPLTLLMATIEEVEKHLCGGTAASKAAARHFLPGPLTIITPRPEWVDMAVVAGFDTVGIRIPNDSACRALLALTGPLATTSANLSGGLPYIGVEGTQVPLVDFFIDRGLTVHGQASSVIDFSRIPPRIVREGALSAAVFEQWYRSWQSGLNEEVKDL